MVDRLSPLAAEARDHQTMDADMLAKILLRLYERGSIYEPGHTGLLTAATLGRRRVHATEYVSQDRLRDNVYSLLRCTVGCCASHATGALEYPGPSGRFTAARPAPSQGPRGRLDRTV